MNIQHILRRCLPRALLPTVAEIDAEIREELEFHLDMRTQENVQAGMSPENASRDAQQRFGDFESYRQTCRQITLGRRLMLQHVRTGLLALLSVVVVAQGVLLARVQIASRNRIETLTHMVEQLQRDPATGPVSGIDRGTAIPYIQWNLSLPDIVARAADKVSAEEFGSRCTRGNPLQHPWSDWQPLEHPRQPN